jgi:hypothetical protein
MEGKEISDLSAMRKSDLISMLNMIVMSMCLDNESRSITITSRAFEEAVKFTTKHPNAYINFDTDQNGDINLTLMESIWEK